MSQDVVTYPYLNLLFRLSVDGTEVLSFSECSGLGLETATEDYAEGGENRFTYKLPVRGQVPNLVLKRGVTNSTYLWDWFAAFLNTGQVDPRDGQIELYASPEDETPVRTWSFTRAYPVKWSGPELSALSPGVAIEAVELTHQGLRLA